MPASPSTTVRRAVSASAEVAATTTRPGSLTSNSHSSRRCGTSVLGRTADRLDIADLPGSAYARGAGPGLRLRRFGRGRRGREAGQVRPGVLLLGHHDPPAEHAHPPTGL